MAGFQVTLIGRFWATAEDEIERDAIQLAIDTLRDIRKTKLGYPPLEQYFRAI
jgi:hypothetical protein